MSEQLEHWTLGKITVMRLLASVDKKIPGYKSMSCDQSGVGKDIPMGRVLVVRTVSYLLKQALFPTTPRNIVCHLSGADIYDNRVFFNFLSLKSVRGHSAIMFDGHY